MYVKKKVPVVMTIAGSDSGGGAGIEADLKAFAALGVHGTVAITSVTAQNTYSVTGVYDLPPEAVVKQIETVYEDMGIDAAKTGMLSNSEIIKAVARTVKRLEFPLVVDPVMVAKSGAPLLRPEAVKTLVEELIPVSTLVTPNVPEAERLSGIKISDLNDAKRAAKIIVEDLGAKAAIVKGGHLSGDKSIDVMYFEGEYYTYEAPRISDGCTHGTGCGFSAAIAAELAKGSELPKAVGVAKRFITMAIDYGIKVGKGHCPINPIAWVMIPAEKFRAIEDVEEAVSILLKNSKIIAPFMPEVGMNIVKAIAYPYARSVEDVIGVEGRIVRVRDGIKQVGPVRPGASSHVARAVLTMMKYNPEYRAALNIGYNEALISAAKKLGLKVVMVSRKEEPPEVKAKEGQTMQWMVSRAVELAGGVPDVIYDDGDIGKEPMIKIFGRSAVEVVEKLIKIIEEATS
jgi:hydroxymethylpyrimidine kinase/phosphomethylpyrimidine kinase